MLAFGKPLTEQFLQEDAFNFEFRRRVSLVFQDSDVQLFMPSVWDELAFAPLQLGVGQEEVKRLVEFALRDLQIEKLREPPRTNSPGAKRNGWLWLPSWVSPRMSGCWMNPPPGWTRAACPGCSILSTSRVKPGKR